MASLDFLLLAAIEASSLLESITFPLIMIRLKLYVRLYSRLLRNTWRLSNRIEPEQSTQISAVVSNANRQGRHNVH